MVPQYQEPHKITYSEDAVVASVKYARRYLSERNLPDIALDIVDEAASQFMVQQEFSTTGLPVMQKHMDELDTLISACEGKDPEKDKAEFDKLYEAYDEFSRQMEVLNEYWGHRLETRAKAGE